VTLTLYHWSQHVHSDMDGLTTHHLQFPHCIQNHTECRCTVTSCQENHTSFTGVNIKSTYVVFSLSQDLLGVLQSYLSTTLAQCCLHHLHHQWLVLLPSSDLQVRCSKFYYKTCCVSVSFLVFGLQMSLLWLLCSTFPCYSLSQDHAFNLVLLFHT